MDALRDGRWLTPARLQAYALMLLAGYALFAVWLFTTSNGVLDVYGRPLGTDFANVWSSGRLVLEGRPEVAFDPAIQRPYQQNLLGMSAAWFYGWHYPPMFLGLAALLSLLPYVPALLVWVASTTTLHVATIRRIAADVAAPPHLVVLLALAYPAVFANFTHGHNGCLTAMLLGLGLYMMSERPVLAGVLFGLVAYKPQYGLLLPIALLVAGAWRTISAATVTVALTVAASALMFGTKSWLAFFTFSAFTREVILESGAAGWFKLQGVFPAVRMLGGSVNTAYAVQAVTIVAMIGFTMWLWRSFAPHAVKAAGLLIASVVANPYAFNYDMVVLGPAIAFLAVEGMKRGFAPFEKSLLALLWLTPLLSRELTQLTMLPIALIVHLAALYLVVAKVYAWDVSAERLAHV